MLEGSTQRVHLSSTRATRATSQQPQSPYRFIKILIVIARSLIGSCFLLRCALYEDERMKSESLRANKKVELRAQTTEA